MDKFDFEPQFDFQPINSSAPVKETPPSFLYNVKKVGKSVIGAVSPELTTAVEAAQSPVGQKLADIGAIPYRGLRGLAEGVAALPEGAKPALDKAAEAVKPDYNPQTLKEKITDFGAQMIEPRALLTGELLKAAAPLAKKPLAELGKQASKLQEVLTGVDAENFQKLFKDPAAILSAPSSKETGAAFQAAKEAAGMTAAEERALATNEGARGRVYRNVMEKIDNINPLQKGEVIKAAGKDLPEQELKHIGPLIADDPAYLRKNGMPEEYIQKGTQPMYNISTPVGEHPAGSSLSLETLRNMGYKIPDRGVQPSVTDLLRAKKAGQLMAESNPSSSGLIYKEIKTKIDPLLKELAPDVYSTQQAVHLSKVKESVLNLFPHGKGMMNYFRVISMLGGSLFHGIGALESPIVQGGLTLGTKGAYKVASSAPARQAIAAGLVKLGDNSDLQSLRDKLKGAE